MKKSNWLMLALFAAASAGLRVWQLQTGFEESGLALRGNLPGLLLPLVLAASVVYFVVAARGLPVRRDAARDFSDCFSADSTAALAGIVAGAFLVCIGAALGALGTGVLQVLLAVFAAASAFGVLCVVFALRRGGAVPGVALLVPVCALIVYLILLYRADAVDPVLARVYIEILAAAALTLSALERAAFAFRDGAPRICVPAGAVAALLALTAAAERQSLSSVLFFAGCALTEAGFLAAANFKKE